MSTWFAHRLVRLGIAGLLAALLIAGAAFTSGALLHPRQAHAAEGCGTGSNDFYTVQKFVQGGITGGDTPGIYYVEQDTCQANATATNFANRANEKDLCASHFSWGATIFGLLGLFTSFANPIAGAGAISGFTLGAECADTKNALTNFSNNIRATAQGCGTQGITYMMRVARNELVLYEAACQTPQKTSPSLHKIPLPSISPWCKPHSQILAVPSAIQHPTIRVRHQTMRKPPTSVTPSSLTMR